MQAILPALIALLLFAGCASVTFEGRGHYLTEQKRERELLLQWKAQTYYIPFLTDRVDYGSFSFQEACRPNILQDRVTEGGMGLAFKERPQDFRLVEGAPRIEVGHFIVCARTKDGTPVEKIRAGDILLFQVLCEAKPGMAAITPANLDGYVLKVRKREGIEALPCGE